MNSARRHGRVRLPFLAFSLTMSACSGLPKGLADFDVGIKQRGMGSWYGVPFDGQVTASGEIYPPSQKATGSSPWMNAGRVSAEALAKADTLRRVPPKNMEMPRP